jgi:hypothetical protein
VTGQWPETHVSPGFTGERHWLRRGRHGGCRGRAFVRTASHPGKLWGRMGKFRDSGVHIARLQNIFSSLLSLVNFKLLSFIPGHTPASIDNLWNRPFASRVSRDDSACTREALGRLANPKSGPSLQSNPEKHGIHLSVTNSSNTCKTLPGITRIAGIVIMFFSTSPNVLELIYTTILACQGIRLTVHI